MTNNPLSGREGALDALNQMYADRSDTPKSSEEPIKEYPNVTRVEVIGNGREYIRYGCADVKISLQDDGKTLKIFHSYQ